MERPTPAKTARRTASARPVRNIDGILPKPAKPVYRPPAGPLHMQYLPKPQGTGTSKPRPQAPRPKTFDDVRPARRQPVPVPTPVSASKPSPAPKPRPVISPVPNPDPTPKPQAQSQSGTSGRQKFSWEGRKAERSLPAGRIVAGLVIAGLSLFSLELGQLALAVYAIIAIWKRWPSQQTFILALAMFGGIIIASLFEPYRYVAENLAVYAFLLLCIGTVSLALEVRRDGRNH